MSDYAIIEPDMQRAIESWENEGGWSTTAVYVRTRADERSGPGKRIGGADSRARTVLEFHRLPVRRAGESAPAAGAALLS